MSEVLLEREQDWLTRIDEIKVTLRKPGLTLQQIRILQGELKKLTRWTLKSFYEGTEAALPSEVFTQA